MASPYILSERMMHMFDDLNVESYARFAYLELSRRFVKLCRFGGLTVVKFTTAAPRSPHNLLFRW